MVRSISVSLTPDSLPATTDLSQSCSVVIDVLRATSVMVTAGDAGVLKIFTCGSIEQAFEFASSRPTQPLLCGERNCQPIAGFSLGNSPAEYTTETVSTREMILTTTNGTRAINAAGSSRRLLVSSFLNLDATVAAIKKELSLQIVCAGTNGEISYEDVLLAGAIVDRLAPELTNAIDDSARIAWHAWKQAQDQQPSLGDSLRQSLGGRNLLAAGFGSDIELCAKVNSINGIVERVGDHSDRVFVFRRSLT